MFRFIVSCCLVLLWGTTALADAPPPIKLLLTPAKPPTPSLRYQLLPDVRVASNSDAAPLYKQIFELLDKKGHAQNSQLFYEWSALPLNQLPREEVRKMLAAYDEVYQLLDKATLCERCDFGIRKRLREKGIGALLPEIEPMRECATILVLRARLEMAEGHLDKTLLTLRNGFSLARHIGEADTIVNLLVGVAIAGQMESQLDELLKRPEAPNLYYALTDLPAPLFSMRRAIEGERIWFTVTFPDLMRMVADLEAGDWTPKQLEDGGKLALGLGMIDPKLGYLNRVLVANAIRNKHEVAKKALLAAGRPSAKVEAMPPLQVALLHAFSEYETGLDNMIVWQTLPYWEMTARLKDIRVDKNKRLLDPNAPALPLATLLLPAVEKMAFARACRDRKIALLRTIEALRFYAANHEGRWPRNLAAVQEVPIPLDPVTGKSFDYQIDGDTATLSAPPPQGEKPNTSNTVVYTLRFRK